MCTLSSSLNVKLKYQALQGKRKSCNKKCFGSYNFRFRYSRLHVRRGCMVIGLHSLLFGHSRLFGMVEENKL